MATTTEVIELESSVGAVAVDDARDVDKLARSLAGLGGANTKSVEAGLARVGSEASIAKKSVGGLGSEFDALQRKLAAGITPNARLKGDSLSDQFDKLQDKLVNKDNANKVLSQQQDERNAILKAKEEETRRILKQEEDDYKKHFDKLRAAAKGSGSKMPFGANNATPTALKAPPKQISGFARMVNGVGSVFGKDAAAGLVQGAAKLAEMSERYGPVAGKITSGLKTMGIAAAGATALVVAAVAAAGVAIGKLLAGIVSFSVKSAGFKKNTLDGLEAMLGTKDAAAATYKEIKKFADATPFETQDVAKWTKGLLGAGFKLEETKNILAGLSDVAALNEFDTEIVKSLSTAIGQIKGKGKLMTEEINQLVENSGGVISRTKVYAELSKITGKSLDETIKMLETGKIDADKGIKGILEVIRTGVSGGELGKLSKRLGEESVQGLSSTISSKFTSMFEDVDLGPLLGTLKNVASVLNSPDGDKLSKSLTGLGSQTIKNIFGPLSTPEGKEAIVNFFGEVAAGADYLTGVLKKLEPAGKWILKSLDMFFGKRNKSDEGMVAAGKDVRDGIIGMLQHDTAQTDKAVGDLLGNVAPKAYEMAGKIGEAIVGGAANAVTGGAGKLINAVVSMVSGSITAGMVAQDAHSPSKAWEQVMTYGVDGAVLGYERGAPRVWAAAADMAGGAVGAGAGAMGGGGMSPGLAGAQIVVTNVFHLPPGAGGENSRGLADDIEARVRREMVAFFRRLGVT